MPIEGAAARGWLEIELAVIEPHGAVEQLGHQVNQRVPPHGAVIDRTDRLRIGDPAEFRARGCFDDIELRADQAALAGGLHIALGLGTQIRDQIIGQKALDHYIAVAHVSLLQRIDVHHHPLQSISSSARRPARS